MALVSSQVSSLINGVSQQPASLRFPSQVEAQDNAYSSIASGLTKRHPSQHVAGPLSGVDNISGAFSHLIDRDTSERYIVLAYPSSGDAVLKVFDLTTGTEKDVYDATTAGSLVTAADLAYLYSADMAQDLRAVTVVDHTWLVNSTTSTAMHSTSVTPSRKNEALVVIWKYKHAHTYKIRVEDKVFHWRTRKYEINPEASGADTEKRNAAQNQGWLAEQLFVELSGQSVSAAGLDADMHVAANGTGDALTQPGAASVSGTGGVFDFTGTTTNNNGKGLNGDGNATVTGAGQKIGWVVKQTGPVIHIYRDDEADFDISVVDDSGEDALTVIKGEVQVLSDLPTKAPHDMQVKIIGDEEEGVDDEYYVKFTVNQADTDNDAYQAERQYGASSTDTEAMSDGVWAETTAPDIPNQFEASTMPHKLIRRSDGHFAFVPGTWNNMEVGDADTNPQPSFIGETIRDIFFFKNRIGFLADDNVIMSETAQYSTFWRTTIVQLLDADPIDVGIAHTSVARANHAIPFQSSLILFTDTSQFVLSGDEILSPKTTTIEYSTEFENSPLVRPVTTGRSIFFAEKRSAFSGVREWYQVIKDEMHDALEITSHCPTYISGNIVTLAGSTHDNILIVRADGDPDSIYVYKYLVGKDAKLQSSWSRYILEGATILDIGWVDTSLYLVLQRTNASTSDTEIFIEKMIIEPGLTDTDSTGTSIDFVCNLDRRVTEAECTRVNSDGLTTITLPYVRGDLDYQVMVRKTFTAPGGVVYPVGLQLPVANPTETTGNTITVHDPYRSGSRTFDKDTASIMPPVTNQFFTSDDSTTTSTGDVDFWCTAWFKLAVKSYADLTPILLAKGPDVLDADEHEYMIYYNGNGGRMRFTVANGSASVYAQTIPAVTNINQWHFLLCWKSKSDNKIYIQIDDEAAEEADNASNLNTDNTEPFRIGADGTEDGTGDSLWDGAIAKVGFGKPPGSWTPASLHAILWNDGKGVTLSNISDEDKATYGLEAGTGVWFPLNEESGNAIDAVGGLVLSANNLEVYPPGTAIGPNEDDFTTAEFFVGCKYSMEVELSRPYLKPQPNSPNYAAGRYQLLYGHLIFHDSDYIRVEVQPSRGRTKRTTLLNGGLLGATKIVGQRGTSSGELKFPIYGRNDQTTITVINDTPFSSAIMGLEYEASFNPRAARIG